MASWWCRPPDCDASYHHSEADDPAIPAILQQDSGCVVYCGITLETVTLTHFLLDCPVVADIRHPYIIRLQTAINDQALQLALSTRLTGNCLVVVAQRTRTSWPPKKLESQLGPGNMFYMYPATLKN